MKIFLERVQHGYCANVMVTESHNGNTVINNIER